MQEPSSALTLLFDRQGHVRLITFNRPEKMNSLDFQASGALVGICQEFNADAEAPVGIFLSERV